MKSYLMHHGILGQKWGVRRYQNSDGSLTEEGKKRYANNLSNAYKNDKIVKKMGKGHPYLTSDDFKNTVEKAMSSVVTKEDAETAMEMRKKALNLSSKVADAEQEYEDKCYREAYDECYKWFEKNEPNYLKEIIKNNNGEKAGLDNFHDFDTALDGYLDDAYSRNKKEFEKQHPEVKQADKAWDEYMSYTKSLTNKLLGKYGNTNINGVPLNSIVFYNTSIEKIIDNTLKSR